MSTARLADELRGIAFLEYGLTRFNNTLGIVVFGAVVCGVGYWIYKVKGNQELREKVIQNNISHSKGGFVTQRPDPSQISAGIGQSQPAKKTVTFGVTKPAFEITELTKNKPIFKRPFTMA